MLFKSMLFLAGTIAGFAASYGLYWVSTHYIFLSNEEMQAFLMYVLATSCPN